MSWLSRLCQCTSRPRSGSHHQVVDRETPKQPSQPAQSGDTDCDDGTLCLATLISCSGCFTLNDRTTSHIKILSQNLPGVTEENHKGFQVIGIRVKIWTLCVVCLFPWASAASHGCTAACWLIVPPALDVQSLATRCPRAYRRVPHSSGGRWNLWAGNRTGNFA
jgi:hypothetical protein